MSSQAAPGAVLFARNLATTARFYEHTLRARVEHADEHHVVLATGPMQLVVHAIPAHIARHIVVQAPPALREDTAIKLVFVVDSLAAVRARAAALGGGLAPPEREWAAPGFRACDGWDPEGNVIQCREPAR